MSDIQRRIVTLFEARGASQVRAALGEMRSGFGMWQRDAQGVGRELSVVDRQMRAMGTTARYALSGLTIFGTVGVVNQLNQIQQQLGLISAISPTAFGGVRLSGEVLRDFGEDAEDAAFRARSSITEFNEGLVNLVSTVQNVPRDEVVPILEQIAQTARLSLTPVDEATKGITGLLVAFNQPATLRNTQRMLAEYQRLIFTVPGGAAAGPQIIQQLPQLAAVSRLAAVNPEQMFGLLNTVLRAGGSPSTSARGLQYLIQGLAQPPSDEARAALRGIGITPQLVQQEGGIAALFRLIQEIRTRGIGGNVAGLRGMSEETLQQLEGITGPGQLQGLGISGAGAEFARTAVGRIHGVRSLILLAAQEDQAIEDLRAMAELGRDHRAQVRELRDSWRAFTDEAQLQEVGLAVNQMAIDVVQAFEPLLNFVGQGVVELRNLFERNPDLASYGLVGTLGALYMGRRSGVFRGRSPIGALGIGHAAYSAATNLGQEAQLGASPTNPMFVAIVYSLAGRGAAPAPVVTGGGADTPNERNRRGRRGIPGFIAGLGGGPLAVSAGILSLSGATRQTDPADVEREARDYPRLMNLIRQRMRGATNFSPVELQALQMMENARPGTRGWSDTRAGYAERLLEHVANLGRGGRRDTLKGEAEITVYQQDQAGRKTKVGTVPLELFPQFTQPAPQTRAQPKTHRGGQ